MNKASHLINPRFFLRATGVALTVLVGFAPLHLEAGRSRHQVVVR